MTVIGTGPKITVTNDRWVLGLIAVPVAAGDVWAVVVDRFVPTALGDTIALMCAVLVASFAALFAAKSRSFAPDSSYYQALLKRWPEAADVRTRVGAFAAIGFLGTFGGTQQGFLDWWTLASGSEGARTVTVSSFRSGGRSSACVGYYVREEPFLLRPAVCTHGRSHPRVPDGESLRLFGKTSPVGIDVHDFRALGPQPLQSWSSP
jgi:hypothetical protein